MSHEKLLVSRDKNSINKWQEIQNPLWDYINCIWYYTEINSQLQPLTGKCGYFFIRREFCEHFLRLRG